MWCSYRPHYASCLSVPSRFVTQKQENVDKTGIDVPPGASKQNASFQLKRSKVKVTGHQERKNVTYLEYMFT